MPQLLILWATDISHARELPAWAELHCTGQGCHAPEDASLSHVNLLLWHIEWFIVSSYVYSWIPIHYYFHKGIITFISRHYQVYFRKLRKAIIGEQIHDGHIDRWIGYDVSVKAGLLKKHYTRTPALRISASAPPAPASLLKYAGAFRLLCFSSAELDDSLAGHRSFRQHWDDVELYRPMRLEQSASE